jgi:hypothetical protein
LANIYIRFFPNDVTEEQITTLIEEYTHLEKVTILRSKVEHMTTAIVSVDLSQAAANIIARKISGHLYEGMSLKAVALLH